MVSETAVVEEPFKYRLPDWLVWEMKEGEFRQHLAGYVYEYGDLIYIDQPYEDNYKNCSVREFYGFTKKNELIHMSYTFREDYILSTGEHNKYNEIYIEFKEELTKIYGEPSGETEEWKNERYKGDEYMKYKAI